MARPMAKRLLYFMIFELEMRYKGSEKQSFLQRSLHLFIFQSFWKLDYLI